MLNGGGWASIIEVAGRQESLGPICGGGGGGREAWRSMVRMELLSVQMMRSTLPFWGDV
jgi:hypothetical protein